MEEICKILMHRQTPSDWKIIMIHSKERELKLSPRLFAMMCLEMKLYFCATEKNISEVIFRYFPQQSMTSDEEELTKRLYALGAIDKDISSFLPLISSLDFKSWNIHWQQSTTALFFRMIDDLFGTPGLYTYTHQFFSESLISLASHQNPPESLRIKKGEESAPRRLDPSECDTLWYDHLGGFEGLRQKGWTLITIGLLLLVEYKTAIRSYILGQGDNQIAKILIDKRQSEEDNETFIVTKQDYITETVDLFITTLDECARDIGLEINPAETWISSRLIIYGKDMLYQGAYLPQTLKKISRTFPDVNEIYPTLYSKISTLQTCGLSAAQKGFSLVSPYVVCQLESIMTILRDARYSILASSPLYEKDLLEIESGRFITFLLHLSSDVSACPFIPWINYLYRGHPDDLTSYTTMLTMGAANLCYRCQQMITYLYRKIYKMGKRDPELLLTNPTAVNIYTPPQLSSIM